MKPKGALIEIEAKKQGEAVKLDQQILCLAFAQSGGLAPQARDDPDRDVRILGEDRQLGEPSALLFV